MTKGPDAFRTISEAADELGVPQHVLRFWETRFSFIRPMKRAGGRRFYRPHDIEILAAIKTMLHGKGYSIKGVQLLHKADGLKSLIAVAGEGPTVVAPKSAPLVSVTPTALGLKSPDGLSNALVGLLAAKRRLDDVLRG